MPLQKTIPIGHNGSVYLWDVTEPELFLSQRISLAPYSVKRLAQMKSELHRRAYLSIRHLMALAGYTDQDLFYDAIGKPHLKDGSYVSISHSFTQTALVVHKNIPVGIDVELQRKKILRIAHKFTPFNAHTSKDILNLTHIWAAKETIYKMASTPGLSFLKDISVFWRAKNTLGGCIRTAQQDVFYDLNGFEIGDFGGVWGMEIEKASAREGQLKEAYATALKKAQIY